MRHLKPIAISLMAFKLMVAFGTMMADSVEGDTAEIRHYIARLARKSRYFSRCPVALQCALKLFVFAFNRTQLR